MSNSPERIQKTTITGNTTATHNRRWLYISLFTVSLLVIAAAAILVSEGLSPKQSELPKTHAWAEESEVAGLDVDANAEFGDSSPSAQPPLRASLESWKQELEDLISSHLGTTEGDGKFKDSPLCAVLLAIVFATVLLAIALYCTLRACQSNFPRILDYRRHHLKTMDARTRTTKR